MQFDAEQLLLAINQGQEPEKAHIDELANSLTTHLEKECLNSDDVYSNISVLLKLENNDYLNIIDSYLAQQDPLLVSLVLESLCLGWELWQRYDELLLELILGCDWDFEEDAQLSAMKIVGQLIRNGALVESHTKAILLKAMFSLFSGNEADPFIRQACYRSMLLAAEVPIEDIPNEFIQIDLSPGSEEVDWELMAKLKQSSNFGSATEAELEATSLEVES